jgi:hypothetical protein
MRELRDGEDEDEVEEQLHIGHVGRVVSLRSRSQ